MDFINTLKLWAYTASKLEARANLIHQTRAWHGKTNS